MLVGVPKAIKDNEYRVGIVPSTVRELTENGHRGLIEPRSAKNCLAGKCCSPISIWRRIARRLRS